jgi:hypothetical protein
MNVHPDHKRDAAAVVLAESAAAWPIVTLKRPHGAFPVGSCFYGVPSSKLGASYLANAVACYCPDYRRRDAVCKHVRAVRLFEQARHQEAAAQAAPTPKRFRTYAELFGLDED